MSLNSSLNIASITFNEVRVEIRSKVFEGFNLSIDTNLAQNIEEAIIFTVSALYGLLETSNLVSLLKYAKLRHFKLHKAYRIGEEISGANKETSTKGISKIVIVDDIEDILS